MWGVGSVFCHLWGGWCHSVYLVHLGLAQIHPFFFVCLVDLAILHLWLCVDSSHCCVLAMLGRASSALVLFTSSLWAVLLFFTGQSPLTPLSCLVSPLYQKFLSSRSLVSHPFMLGSLVFSQVHACHLGNRCTYFLGWVTLIFCWLRWTWGTFGPMMQVCESCSLHTGIFLGLLQGIPLFGVLFHKCHTQWACCTQLLGDLIPWPGISDIFWALFHSPSPSSLSCND